MFKKITGIYSIFMGICITGMWSMIIATGEITEGPFEITFHLISEFTMAILLIFCGIYILKKNSVGDKLLYLSHGMLIYSVLNAAGYYGQRGDIPFTAMFITFLIISTIILIISLNKKSSK